MLAIIAIAPKERQRIAPGVNPWEDKNVSHKEAQNARKRKERFNHLRGGIYIFFRCSFCGLYCSSRPYIKVAI